MRFLLNLLTPPRSRLGILSLTSFMGACTPGPTPVTMPLDHLNRVTLHEQACPVPWDAQNHEPSSATLAALHQCLQPLTPEDGTYVEIEVPSHLKVSGQGSLYASALQEHIHRETGLHPSRISWHYSSESSEANLLVFQIHSQSYAVAPPDCGSKPYVMGGASVDPWVDLGCATSSNLGLMIQDPRDLLEGRSPDPSPAQPLISSVESLLGGTNASSSGSGGSSSGGGSGGSINSAVSYPGSTGK